ncbi:hypothetical protein [Streptomyces sedi]|uniref:Uncharacterized protein n=1 Tax=Streptomyces sedi TaxID=555059 RepID=A0A5C4UKB9_9ACTN|nr:hypothetical protein [Streptomyces sedi]TNM24127.1 hypothetical protein FH715_27590 [Streptomyces sedi]
MTTRPAHPQWTDDLFPFPTPPALARAVDLAWEADFLATDLYEEGLYDAARVQGSAALPFDLCEVPRAPRGWEYTDPWDATRRPHTPHRSVPELLPFADLGTGTCVGWAVPAPELGRDDHPVAVFGHRTPAVVGRDTRDGLAYLLGLAHPDDAARLASALGLTTGQRPTGDAPIPLDFAPPPGWRHEPCPSGVGLGVLAPADAFADTYPTFLGDIDDILTGASDLLDAGAPASALLGLTAAYHEDPERLTDLHPLWARAYDALDRPFLRARLEAMAEPPRRTTR